MTFSGWALRQATPPASRASSGSGVATTTWIRWKTDTESPLDPWPCSRKRCTGRILAVCDSFDAMVSRRAYKDALSVEYAIGELEKGKGTQFDPDVAEAFIELIEEDPSFQVKAS